MSYDCILVGSGLGGSSLAKNLAERGYGVLVLERETRFKDRVRGEQMHPRGVTAARSLRVRRCSLRARPGSASRVCCTSFESVCASRPTAGSRKAATRVHREPW